MFSQELVGGIEAQVQLMGTQPTSGLWLVPILTTSQDHILIWLILSMLCDQIVNSENGHFSIHLYLDPLPTYTSFHFPSYILILPPRYVLSTTFRPNFAPQIGALAVVDIYGRSLKENILVSISIDFITIFKSKLPSHV